MPWHSLLWTLVPGVGQIHVGRCGRGIALFTLFALLLNAYCLSPFLTADPVVRMALLALTVLAWLIAAVDYLRWASSSDAEWERG